MHHVYLIACFLYLCLSIKNIAIHKWVINLLTHSNQVIELPHTLLIIYESPSILQTKKVNPKKKSNISSLNSFLLVKSFVPHFFHKPKREKLHYLTIVGLKLKKVFHQISEQENIC